MELTDTVILVEIKNGTGKAGAVQAIAISKITGAEISYARIFRPGRLKIIQSSTSVSTIFLPADNAIFGDMFSAVMTLVSGQHVPAPDLVDDPSKETIITIALITLALVGIVALLIALGWITRIFS